MTSQFSGLLRQFRRRTGMTQEGLAARSGVAVRTIRRLERGESTNPQMETVRLLADALELKADERARLLAAADGKHEPPPPELPALDSRLVQAVDALAQAVGGRWRREEERRRIHDPFPLPVSWRPTPDAMDHWDNICRTSPGHCAEPDDLAGQLDEIVQVYQRIPAGRLVVLGKAGSGKTILAVRFVLDLLKTRPSGGTVPVVVGLASWNPTTTLFRDWLISQLVRDYPGLAATGPGAASLAEELVDADRILPVLDGFDEIAEGQHKAAFEALNATTLPLLLTSRPDEYLATGRVLTAAAVVTMADLTLKDLLDYLPRTARKAQWEPFLKSLSPDSDLARVLTTPLMVGLARTIYSDRDPAGLLDFTSTEAIEEHLLGSFVPTVYQHDNDSEAHRWFSYLAQHMHRLGTRDLAWWQLGASLRRPVRAWVVGLVVGLFVGLADSFIELALSGEVVTLLGGLVVGPAAGVAMGFAYDLVARPGGALEPTRVRVRVRGGTRRRTFFPRFRIGLLGGLVLGFGYGLLRGVVLKPFDLLILADAALFAVAFGVAAGVAFGAVGLFEAPLDIGSAVSPAGLLAMNRRTVVFQFVVLGPAFGIVILLATFLLIQLLRATEVGAAAGIGFIWDPGWALAAGLVGWLGGGLAYALGLTAWGQWVVFARIWLPLTGRLPWEMIEFLDDACRRGVLRQAGAVYQFRHARLQDQLAANTDRT